MRRDWRLALAVVPLLLTLTPLAVLGLYAFSAVWTAPDVLPSRMTLHWFRYLFRYENAWPALLLSLEVTGLVSLAALLAGVPAGYALAQHRFAGCGLVTVLLAAKTAVPVMLIGLGTASLFASLGLTDTLAGVVLAHLVGATPLVVWTSAAAFAATAPGLDEAARDAGAGFARRFLEIAVPLAAPGLLAGFVLAFLFSMIDPWHEAQ